MVSPRQCPSRSRNFEEEVGFARAHHVRRDSPLAGRSSPRPQRAHQRRHRGSHGAASLTGQVTGTVTIGAFLTPAAPLHPRHSPDLADALPGVNLRIEETEETLAWPRCALARVRPSRHRTRRGPGPGPRGYTDVPFSTNSWMLVTPDSAPPIGSIEDLAPPGCASIRAPAATTSARRITKAFPDTRWAPHLLHDLRGCSRPQRAIPHGLNDPAGP